jgi:uncharacterized protein YifE (UPF0438 family)
MDEDEEPEEEDEQWFTEVCIAIRGPRSLFDEAYDKLVAYARKLKGVQVSEHCDSSDAADGYK